MSTPSEPSREERILAELQRMYALKIGGGGVMIAIGAGILFAAGLIVSAVVAFLFWNFFDTSLIGWTGWFIVYVIAIVWLVRRERKLSQVTFFDDSHSNPSGAANPDDYENAELHPGAAASPRLADRLMWAPQALLSGIDTYRGEQPTRFKGLLVRASLVALQLYDSKDPIELKKLIHAGEPPAEFREVLKWLDDNDHIGFSSDGQRAWLSSKLRAKLVNDGF